jgi:hypothetical protein
MVDRDGLPHRLVHVEPLVLSAYEVVKCHKKIELLESRYRSDGLDRQRFLRSNQKNVPSGGLSSLNAN